MTDGICWVRKPDRNGAEHWVLPYEDEAMTDYLDTDETPNVHEMRFPPADHGGFVVAWCVVAVVFGLGFLAGALIL